jgi:hypothetical protein
MSSIKVGEQVPTIELARLLEDYGLPSPALPHFNGIPDIYLVWGGLRVIIELKEAAYESQLRDQLDDRLVRRVCDLGVGILYPPSLITGALTAPTPRDIERRLPKTDLKVFALAPAGLGSREIARATRCRPSQLPELITRYAAEAMPIAELEEAIDKVAAAVTSFAINIQSISGSQQTATRIREVLEGVTESQT